MRINVYSQELTQEVIEVSKVSNTGIDYKAVQFVLHSSPMLHHPPQDDDRSAVTFWLPQSVRGLEEFEFALRQALSIVQRALCVEEGIAAAATKLATERFNATYDANARRRGQYDEVTAPQRDSKHE